MSRHRNIRNLTEDDYDDYYVSCCGWLFLLLLFSFLFDDYLFGQFGIWERPIDNSSVPAHQHDGCMTYMSCCCVWWRSLVCHLIYVYLISPSIFLHFIFL